jgi:tRNA threonylcarbamoyl adenosine modification protein (Sua5/YciO/YrdC/YwlC family)
MQAPGKAFKSNSSDNPASAAWHPNLERQDISDTALREAVVSDGGSLKATSGNTDGAAAASGSDLTCSIPENAEGFRGKGTVMRCAAVGAVERAVELLRKGGVVAIPTDTLYGLAGQCTAEASIDRIYEIKGRDRNLPLALCIAEASDVPAYAQCEHLPSGLLDALFPGPVTVVLKHRQGSIVARNLNPGRQTVALRVPDSGFIRAVCREAGVGLVLTSANVSGEPSTLAAEQFSGLWPCLDVVFDGGRIVGDPLGSTIVDLSCAEGYTVLRDGSALRATEAILARYGVSRLPVQGGAALVGSSK